MSLAWNPVHRNGLASGSADNTVKLWDLNTGNCAATLAHCDDKVQAVRWHPTEGAPLRQIIETTVAYLMLRSDCAHYRNGVWSTYRPRRAQPDSASVMEAWSRFVRRLHCVLIRLIGATSGIEQVAWNPHAPQFFLASTESGEVGCFNALQAGSVVWRLGAHNKEVTALSMNPQV